MWIKLIGLGSISLAFILYGFFWYRKGLKSQKIYAFKEDLKHTFFTIRGSYSGTLNDDKPRKIAPAMTMLCGVIILIVGLLKVFGKA